jgi:hypothetical protein
MKNWHRAAIFGAVVCIATAVWAQRLTYDNAFEFIGEHLALDRGQSNLIPVRDYARLLDSYTTGTDAQKFDGLLKACEAFCSHTTVAKIKGEFSAIEKQSWRIIWAGYGDQYDTIMSSEVNAGKDRILGSGSWD